MPARPLLTQPLPTHRVLDLSSPAEPTWATAIVVPARQAVALTARWLAEHPPAPGGPEETVLTDPFDYDAEDRLMDGWAAALGRPPGHRPGTVSPATGSPTAVPAGVPGAG